MPRAMIDHIDSEKVLPTSDLLKAQDVTSFGVIEPQHQLPSGLLYQILGSRAG